MISESQLRQEWEQRSPMYRAWGEFLTQTIMQKLQSNGLDGLVKIPPVPRTKESDSLVNKFFYRNPGKYSDPWNELEDFVGTRFVVLRKVDIESVATTIQGLDDEGITTVVARDPMEIERVNPNSFEYVSTHLICRPENDIDFDGTIIAKDTPCEVQVRTLLQHAWSETTHNTLYKNLFESSPTMKRSSAKSSALIEATGDYFESVYAEISRKEKALDKITQQLIPVYSSQIGTDPLISSIEQQMINSYHQFIPTNLVESGLGEAVNDLILQKPFISKRVRERLGDHLVYKQPSILLMYWLIKRSSKAISSYEGGLPEPILSQIFTDLGEGR